MTTGLRERKKRRTKAAIADAALDLFLAKGFEQTTIAEIAEAAEVSPRTFFSYFQTKEEAAFAKSGPDELDRLRRGLGDRASSESAIDALWKWLESIMDDPDFNDERELSRRRLIGETPALTAYEMTAVDTRFRAILAAAVAEDLGIDAGDLRAQMVAAAASAALRTLVDHMAHSDAQHDPAELLERARAFLEAGLESLADGSGS